MTPLKYVTTILLFWLIVGGLFQVLNINAIDGGDVVVNTERVEVSLFGLSGLKQMVTFVWDLMTFNVVGMPDAFRFSLTTFLTSTLLLSIYVLFRSGS